ncbi:MAG TPA: hypothetical protein DEA26_00605 [Oceanospirillales bacterium]|nr:hypothetical protein [Oceanospirillaceae bacterium]HBS41148.1 hypothetical protein [Oceanospirillales bacterium]
MNYLNEERLDVLASRYVVGQMKGQARSRFRTLMQTYQKVRERVWYWERLLSPMNDSIPPRQPDDAVWAAIEQRLWPDAAISTTLAANDEPSVTSPRWQILLPVAASLLLGVLLIAQINRDPAAVPMVTEVAVIQSDNQPLWLVEMTATQMTVRATQQVEQRNDADYELWIVPADGTAPVSLGLIPESGSLTRDRLAALDTLQIAALAVSREQPGGSVTGLPGEVLFTAQLTTL